MNSMIRTLFVTSLLFSVGVCDALAQRSVGARNLVLDDGLGRTMTLTVPSPLPGPVGSNYNYTFPLQPVGSTPGFVTAGTAGNQLLRWNAVTSAWEPSSIITNTGSTAAVTATNLSPALVVTNNGTGLAAQFSNPGAGFGSYTMDVTATSSNIAIEAHAGSGWFLPGYPCGVYGESGIGEGVEGSATSGIGVFGGASTGTGVYAEARGTGNGIMVETDNGGVSTTTNSNAMIIQTNFVNVARIDNTGKGYFNGGTQASGADVAEAFRVEGDRSTYEPGDVLVVSTESDRTVEKCHTAASTAVVGVYATKPGVLLSERTIDQSQDDLVPMGVVGVIPTKVTTENGPIHRGDLLVTSSTPGCAMKASAKFYHGTAIYPAGAILGKALENFTSKTPGKIRVMVNVK